MNAKQTTKRWRAVMLAWTWFETLGALGGGAMGMLSPDGALYGGQTMVSSVQALGFSNLFIPALGLFTLIGIGNLVAALFIMRHLKAGAYLACIEGLILAVFEVAELVILGVNPLSIIYLVLGLMQFACGMRYLHLYGEIPPSAQDA